MTSRTTEEDPVSESSTATTTVTEVVLPGKVDPSDLEIVQRSLPAPAAGQALVRVESTAVSFAESAMRRGRYYGPATTSWAPSTPSAPAWTARCSAAGWPR
jgi:NADPH2:quinone reductase